MGNDDSSHFQLNLFQSWQLHRGANIVDVAARQQRLIAALAINGPRPRSYVAGLLWPEHPEPRAMESLRASLHLVTRQMPGLLINPGAVLSLSDLVDVDLHRVRWQIRQLHQGGLNGSAALFLHELRHAELLPGWYQDWVVFEQSRLRQDRLHALLVMARTSVERCDYEVAQQAAEAALELEPLYESAVRFLIRAEWQQGNDAAALRAFEKYQARLSEDMGIAPSETIQRLVADIRRSRNGEKDCKDRLGRRGSRRGAWATEDG